MADNSEVNKNRCPTQCEDLSARTFGCSVFLSLLVRSAHLPTPAFEISGLLIVQDQGNLTTKRRRYIY